MPSPWLTFRQASDAVTGGRPEDAHRLIEPLLAEGYRKAWRLARDVVRGYCQRARRALDRDSPEAAWHDLLAAEALNTGEKCVGDLRLTLTRFGLVQARGALEAGRPLEVIETVTRLHDRGMRHPELARAVEAAQDWVLAAELADRGDFLLALSDLGRIRDKLNCPPTGLNRFRAEVEARHNRFREAVARLYDAAESRRWREALAAAEEVLADAPEHREAQVIRARAWQAAHPETRDYVPTSSPGLADAAVSPVDLFGATRAGEAEQEPTPHSVDDGDRDRPRPVGTRAAARLLTPPTIPSAPAAARAAPPLSGPGTSGLPKRFLLWVDGVGGYLVCPAPRVTFGLATPDGPVDVPLYADVSRLHAEVSRDGEGYVIESGKGVLVNGQEVGRAVLTAGDRLTLGSTCQFMFHRPVSVSSTARLELTSGHRLTLPVDGVLLMGNELILGPGPQVHIPVSDSPVRVLLYRSKDGIGVRVEGDREFRVGDRPHTDRALLTFPSVVSTDTFAFAVEPVGPRV